MVRSLAMTRPAPDPAALLDDLFLDDRPDSPDELRERLSPLDHQTTRTLLLDRLRRAGAPPRDNDLLIATFQLLGLEDPTLDALAELLIDATAPVSARAFALALLSVGDAGRAQTLARGLDTQDLIALNEAQLLTVIARMPAAPAQAAQEITRKIAKQPPAARVMRLEQIDRVRRSLRVPATMLYADLLLHPELQIADRALDLISEEGGQGPRLLLDHVLRSSEKAALNPNYWAALARLDDHPERPPIHDIAGHAWISGDRPDATLGAVVALENPIDASYTLVAARLTVGGPVLGAMIAPLATRRDIKTLLGAPSPFIYSPVSLAEVGALVTNAAARARDGREPATLDVCAAVAFFDQARRAAPEPSHSEAN